MKIARHKGPLATAGMMLVGILILDWLCTPGFLFRVVAYLFSGKIFSDTRAITGGTLDHASIPKGYFLFCFFVALVTPFVAVVRWLCDWEQRLVRVIFRILSATLFLWPVSMLTMTFLRLIDYISSMGFTPMRLLGTTFGLVAYGGIFVFLYWAWRHKTLKSTEHERDMA